MSTPALDSGAAPDRPTAATRAVFRPSTPEDRPAVADFLRRVFAAPANHPLIDPAHMEWKYWKPWSCWPGSRSYVLERDGRILAHGAAWPATILQGSESLSAFELIDWAADPAAPGAGIALGNKMARLADIVYVVGGTEAARRTRAAMGLRPRNRVQIVAKPLHPLRQITSDRAWNWKTPARLLRNIAWNLRPDGSPGSEWQAVRASPADIEDSAWPMPQNQFPFFGRAISVMRYLAECPIVRFAFYLLRKREQPIGYFCLTYAPGQARIADCRLISSSTEDWIQLYRLAIAEASRDDSANEIIAWTVNDAQLGALTSCGFHARTEEEIMICDTGQRIPAEARLHLQMVHTDAAFLHGGQPSYLS